MVFSSNLDSWPSCTRSPPQSLTVCVDVLLALQAGTSCYRLLFLMEFCHQPMLWPLCPGIPHLIFPMFSLSPEARTGFILLVVQHPTSHYPTQVCSMGPGFQHPIISSWTFVPVTPPQPYLFGTHLVFKCWWVPSMETCLDLCKPKATTEALPFLVIVGSQRPIRVYLVISVPLSQWNCFFFQSVLRSVCFLAWKKAHTE